MLNLEVIINCSLILSFAIITARISNGMREGNVFTDVYPSMGGGRVGRGGEGGAGGGYPCPRFFPRCLVPGPPGGIPLSWSGQGYPRTGVPPREDWGTPSPG